MKFLVLICGFFFCSILLASEQEARQYFSNRQPDQVKQKTELEEKNSYNTAYPLADKPRYMKVFLGFHYDNKAFGWDKTDSQKDVSQFEAGVGYRFGQWIDSMDLIWQFDFTSFSFQGENPLKFTVMPTLSFPDVSSGFPLYFGLGMGPGFYLKRIKEESLLSVDYKIYGGIRLLNVVKETGFFIETGIRNQVFLLSEGQHNALFVDIGTNFNF